MRDNPLSVASCTPPIRDWTRNPGMSPNRIQTVTSCFIGQYPTIKSWQPGKTVIVMWYSVHCGLILQIMELVSRKSSMGGLSWKGEVLVTLKGLNWTTYMEAITTRQGMRRVWYLWGGNGIERVDSRNPVKATICFIKEGWTSKKQTNKPMKS